jgi:hypothetical protein
MEISSHYHYYYGWQTHIEIPSTYDVAKSQKTKLYIKCTDRRIIFGPPEQNNDIQPHPTLFQALTHLWNPP